MKTDIKTAASFIAAAVWADGFFDESEKEIVNEIAEVLEFGEKEFAEAINAEVETIKDKSEDEVTEALVTLGKNICEKEKGILLECVLEVVLADGVLTSNEVTNILAMAEALGMAEETAVLLLADMVKSEPELEVEL